MAEVRFTVGGRSYRLSCRDGDEPALEAAAAQLDEKANTLIESLGAVSESQLLLMAALQISGELLTTRDADTAPEAQDTKVAAENLFPSAAHKEKLEALLSRVENLTQHLEEAAAST